MYFLSWPNDFCWSSAFFWSKVAEISNDKPLQKGVKYALWKEYNHSAKLSLCPVLYTFQYSCFKTGQFHPCVANRNVAYKKALRETRVPTWDMKVLVVSLFHRVVDCTNINNTISEFFRCFVLLCQQFHTIEVNLEEVFSVVVVSLLSELYVVPLVLLNPAMILRKNACG